MKNLATATTACSASQRTQQILSKLHGFLECWRRIGRGWPKIRVYLKFPRDSATPTIKCRMLKGSGVSIVWMSTPTPSTRSVLSTRQTPAFSNLSARRVYPLASSVTNMTTSYLIGCASLFISRVVLGPRPLCRLMFFVCRPSFNATMRLLLHNKHNKSVRVLRASRLMCQRSNNECFRRSLIAPCNKLPK